MEGAAAHRPKPKTILHFKFLKERILTDIGGTAKLVSKFTVFYRILPVFTGFENFTEQLWTQ
jgi:hypothetical protein